MAPTAAARTLAELLGVDLAAVPSSGPDARITRHGPIINDVVGGVEEEWAFGWQPLAFSWTALQPGTLLRSVLLLDQASNWEEFREALSHWDVPSQNFVYADVEGNIGYQAPGRIPIRAAGDGSMPVPGWTGEYEWPVVHAGPPLFSFRCPAYKTQDLGGLPSPSRLADSGLLPERRETRLNESALRAASVFPATLAGSVDRLPAGRLSASFGTPDTLRRNDDSTDRICRDAGDLL